MQGVFNTLAQSGTRKGIKAPVFVNGKGSEITKDKVKQGRAKRKTITQKMVLGLIDLGKTENKEIQPYWNTYHCQGRIITSNGKAYGNYCKNRFCTLCCSIRKAEIINRYMPVLEKWKDPYFVTLTIKSVPARRLDYIIEKGIIRGFKLIVEKHRKRSQRNKGSLLMGIRALECNFNPKAKTYNPHLHLIVPNKETATLIRDEWLELWTKKFTHKAAQYIRPVENKERDLIEIVKYGSKIFTEPDVIKKAGLKNIEGQIYVAALNNIFRAMKGHRIFERFGFNLPKASKSEFDNYAMLTEYENWEFDPQKSDWINSETGDSLSGYKLPPELRMLFEHRINKELE